MTKEEWLKMIAERASEYWDMAMEEEDDPDSMSKEDRMKDFILYVTCCDLA